MPDVPGTGIAVPAPAHHRTIARRGESLVVVVAHPDDETFGCGSLIAAAARAGADVTVVCATAGELGESTMPVTRRELGRIRLRELDAAAAVLGVTRVVRLGFGDSGVSGRVPAGSLCAATVTEIADRLVGELDVVAPDVVVVLDGSDGHRDHRMIHDAAALAVDRSAVDARQPTRVYELVVPRPLMQQWPATRVVTDVVDTRHVLDRRERAIAMHASHVSPFEAIGPERARRLLTVDHLVRLR